MQLAGMLGRIVGSSARVGTLAIAVLWAAAPSCAWGESDIDPIELSISPIVLDTADPGPDHAPRLIWRGGLEITSDDERFGGFSGLVVSSEGSELLAVSDKGYWFSARLDYDAAGHLAGLDGGRIARLRDLDGEVLEKKKWRDAESLTALEDGATLVSFERNHRIWLYRSAADPLYTAPSAWPQPPGLEDVPKNSGLEALVALHDNGLLALLQDHVDSSKGQAYLWHQNQWSPLTYQRRDGLEVRDAARLPGGDVVVLESGKLQSEEPVVQLIRVATSNLRPHAHLQGSELARVEPPLNVHKFEGIVARGDSAGETLIYLLSDNDFDEDRPTLLVMFSLDD